MAIALFVLCEVSGVKKKKAMVINIQNKTISIGSIAPRTLTTMFDVTAAPSFGVRFQLADSKGAAFFVSPEPSQS